MLLKQPVLFSRVLPHLSSFFILSFVFVLSACDFQELDSKHSADFGGSESELFELSGSTMGTSYLVKFYADQSQLSLSSQAIERGVQHRLDEIESLMSTYQPDSELMRFNRSLVAQPFPLSQNTYHVFSIASDIFQLTQGYFDVTVSPLVTLWGFTRGNLDWRPPSQQQIDSVRENLGQQFLKVSSHLSSAADSPVKHHTDLSLPTYIGLRSKAVEADLSAVAKGYAVDYLANYLEQLGIYRYMVEVGGELSIGAPKTAENPWRIAIEKPRVGVRAVQKVLALQQVAVATSGNYRNFLVYEGKRYGHSLNPKTGYPVSHNLASVTVLVPHKTDNPPALLNSKNLDLSRFPAAYADGLATGLLVAGPELGKKLAIEHHLAVIFYLQMEDDFEQWISPQAKLLLGE